MANKTTSDNQSDIQKLAEAALTGHAATLDKQIKKSRKFIQTHKQSNSATRSKNIKKLIQAKLEPQITQGIESEPKQANLDTISSETIDQTGHAERAERLKRQMGIIKGKGGRPRSFSHTHTIQTKRFCETNPDLRTLPVEQIIYKLASVLCSHEDIATVLGLRRDEVYNHYDEIIRIGWIDAKCSIRRKLFEHVMKRNNPIVNMFLAKNTLGYADNPAGTGTNYSATYNVSIKEIP